MTKLYPWAELAARISLAALFIVAGLGKIAGYEGTAGYMQSMGVPGGLLPFVIALELGGGLAIVGGFLLLVVHGAGRLSLDARRA